MQQEKEQFGYAVVSSRGGKYHVTRVIGTWYGAFAASAICGTKPVARWGMATGWLDLSKHETLVQAAQAAGGLLCSKCLKKARQEAARAEALHAELDALQAETEAEAALTAEALAPIETPADPAAYLQELQQIAAEADPATEAGQAWLADYRAAEQQQQAAARAAAIARAEALPTAEQPAAGKLSLTKIPVSPKLSLTKTPVSPKLSLTKTPAAVEEIRQPAEEQPEPAAEALSVLPERDRQTPTPAAPALARQLTAEALTDYPSCNVFAISAHVYLSDRGYGVVRTIQRNIRRQALLQAFSALVGQEQLSKLVAYPDLCG